jgi:hypothetical protein
MQQLVTITLTEGQWWLLGIVAGFGLAFIAIGAIGLAQEAWEDCERWLARRRAP